ncbi:MAG: hypothetical protein PHO44_07110 [Sphaerochaetaceae bacterium]|nr:hypothetical protein [Sphaerochaetaceae bacterium]MDD4007734.1 hypothetical protein [Sphaerochaetaceae bacterium]
MKKSEAVMFVHRKKKIESSFDPELFDPVLRCSICNSERTAGFCEKATGHFVSVCLIRSDDELLRFCAQYNVKKSDIKVEY